jgi:hypothetical protein
MIYYFRSQVRTFSLIVAEFVCFCMIFMVTPEILNSSAYIFCSVPVRPDFHDIMVTAKLKTSGDKHVFVSDRSEQETNSYLCSPNFV